MERRAILACSTASALFGEAATDARELRRVYAKLAKAWRDDPEVAAHVRSVYEAARDPSPPADDGLPEDRLAQALEDHHPQAIWNVIGDDAPHLMERSPNLLLQGLWVLLVFYGARLGPDVLDRLDALLRDPTWEIAPDRLSVLVQRVVLKREMLRAEAHEAGPPPAVLHALTEAWGARPDVVMAAWLVAARALEGTDLPSLFEDLDRDWPALLGEWSRHEWSLLRLAESEEALLDGVDALKPEYASLYRIRSDVDEALVRETSYAVQVSLSVVLMIVSAFFVPLWLAPLLAYGGRVVLLRLWAWSSRGPRIRRRRDEVLARPIAPLLDFARHHALLPRELAAHLADLRDAPPAVHALSEDHPLLRLDRSNAALLEIVTEAHVARMTRLVEAQGG